MLRTAPFDLSALVLAASWKDPGLPRIGARTGLS
jgi:hypothetical protein